ncbi:MAG TPA: carboxylesterase family protein [Candidatus Acidoferrum sp.]|nr:carboxylesterase family protein [Candidatus Acidoferrum sp.]
MLSNAAFSRKALLALAALFLAATVATTAAQTVVTDTGTFTGVPSPIAPAAVDVFFGIRYAAAPQAAARWTPPQPPTPPTGTVLADLPGPACPQSGSTAPLPQSEDCLFLNVYVPATATPHSKLPVFLWIHGGALVTGTGAVYDPSVMVAENNIIVVTINYRLGALGWLVEPGLIAQTPSFFQNVGDAGNYGLMDQQFALQWVQRNISGFGGEASKVTVGGESAGGLSVSSNLVSTTTAKGLFRSAIIESGAYMLHDVPSELVYGAIFGAGFDTALGCTQPDDATCLRTASVTNILTAQDKVFAANGISPDFGTKVLPRALQPAFSTGEFIRVPVLQGTNANEGRLFEPLEFPFASTFPNILAAGGPANFDLSNPNTFCAAEGSSTPAVCTYPQEINLFLGVIGFPAAENTAAFGAALADEYPLANFPDPFLPGAAPSSDEALAQIFTDLVFACNGSDSNIDLARFVPVFGYEFNDPNAPPTLSFGTAVEPPNDVFGFPSASEHAAELQFLFNFGTPLSADEQQLAGEMKTYWGNFVNTGNPNWPRHSSFWLPFNFFGSVQGLRPGPKVPDPFFNFRQEHFCRTWQPFIAAEVGE